MLTMHNVLLKSRYNKQFELTHQICWEFDRPLSGGEDMEEEKAEQFEKVMNLMQAMQMLGNPPKEICGEVPPGMPGPDQCRTS